MKATETAENGTSSIDRAASRALHGRILEKEKQLRSVLKVKDPSDKAVTVLRNTLRDEYEQLLLSDFDFALEVEVEQGLWKSVFYKRIEEYRKKLAKHKKDNSSSRAIAAYEALCSSFRGFLAEASGFYHSLLNRFQAKYGPADGQLKLPGLDFLAAGSNGGMDLGQDSNILASCQRCLIYLGDLARYRELYSESQKRDWTQAASYYIQASRLVPDNGNPHNQLAVIALYMEDELGAVYQYTRARQTRQPFVNAKGNLGLLYESNRTKFDASAAAGSTSSRTSQASEESSKADFASAFVRLHGMLFTSTSMEKFTELTKSTLAKLQVLLSDNRLSDADLLRVVVICISAVHPPQDGPALTVAPTMAESLRASIVRLHAASLCFEVGAAAAFAGRLPALGVLGVWLTLYPDVLRLKAPSPELVAARSAMLESLADLLNSLQTTKPPAALDGVHEFKGQLLPPLGEDAELQGFLPLEEALKDVPILKRVGQCAQGFSADVVDRGRRVLRLLDFAHSLASNERPLLYVDSRGVFSVEPPKELPAAPQVFGHPDTPGHAGEEDDETFGAGAEPLGDDMSCFANATAAFHLMHRAPGGMAPQGSEVASDQYLEDMVGGMLDGSRSNPRTPQVAPMPAPVAPLFGAPNLANDHHAGTNPDDEEVILFRPSARRAVESDDAQGPPSQEPPSSRHYEFASFLQTPASFADAPAPLPPAYGSSLFYQEQQQQQQYQQQQYQQQQQYRQQQPPWQTGAVADWSNSSSVSAAAAAELMWRHSAPAAMDKQVASPFAWGAAVPDAASLRGAAAASSASQLRTRNPFVP
eukprot:CAMPEP_0114542662 /NCGR_PEP_ID=MMETSP0114-20121206/1949_1 /TAXON_ID=31324 /ORGANISM="Goniomonas sp, Strain m" /LENGTH=815 /DNA_ID=CAMNT_0001726963 /DNA_START=58 /DNA_END=2505 /DNA_ORIENTATION=+